MGKNDYKKLCPSPNFIHRSVDPTQLASPIHTHIHTHSQAHSGPKRKKKNQNKNGILFGNFSNPVKQRYRHSPEVFPQKNNKKKSPIHCSEAIHSHTFFLFFLIRYQKKRILSVTTLTQLTDGWDYSGVILLSSRNSVVMRDYEKEN